MRVLLVSTPATTPDGYQPIATPEQAAAIAQLLLAKGWEWQSSAQPDDQGWLYMAKSCLYGAENDECLIALYPVGTGCYEGLCSRGEPRWSKLSLCCGKCCHQADSTN